VGSAWIDHDTGKITVGISVFPAGVDESDEKRGDPKNVKRRTSRRTRITLARRAYRKRALRLRLIKEGLLPEDESKFKTLLEETDPWILRCKGLTEALHPHQFGRVLLHLSQRRGAVGFDADVGDTGNVKKAIVDLQLTMLDRLGSNESRNDAQQLRRTIESLEKKKSRSESESQELDDAREKLQQLCRGLLKDKTVTVGRLMAMLREERRTPISTPDRRKRKKGPREWQGAIRNKGSKFEFHADRAMLRDEFAKLWNAQKQFDSPLSKLLTDELHLALDNHSRDGDWRHKGLLFGQRKATWDLGTLGRCILHPTDRCAPHADMYASRYLVVETVNNLRIIERGMLPRNLSIDERTNIKNYLCGPLGVITKGKQKGQPKRSVSVTDLRELMGWARSKTPQFRFNIENDEERVINTDWFSREIIHGAVTPDKWAQLSKSAREGINRAILKHDPDDEAHAAKLKALVMQDWTGLSDAEADALVAAWKKRPRPDTKRLNMSRRAVRNVLAVMDRDEPWPDNGFPAQTRWVTQIEARKRIVELARSDSGFLDVTTRTPLDEHDIRRYATGSKGSTAKDRHYAKKHLLRRKSEPIYGPDGNPLHALPPAPLISNPVVRKSIHEVRRHIVEYLIRKGCKPDEIYVELAREAKMGKVQSDRLLFKNRLRNRIRNEIADEFNLDSVSSTQRRAAIDRIILCIQQGEVCPLCGNQNVKTALTPRLAASGADCEVSHIVPKACGGHSGLSNLVLAHTKCNREMRRRTPRDYWNEVLKGGFEEGIAWIDKIFSEIVRPKSSEIKSATGNALWSCYFNQRDDLAKIERFKKAVSDIQEMSPSQLAATTYASRQVMTYLADTLFDGLGLPERGGARLIYATDGLWTSRLRREWELFFDPHGSRIHGLVPQQKHERKEKDRGDHRHHAIDAVAIALATPQVCAAWDAREKQADATGINTADEEAMENYRRLHPLKAPAPFTSPEHLRDEVRQAVFGNGNFDRPVSHRPVKRKLIGALHKATLYGPVVDKWVQNGVEYCELVEGRVTVRQPILGETPTDCLKPAHLRLPRTESDDEAIERISHKLRMGNAKLSKADAIEEARKRVKGGGFKHAIVDPKPEKGGIVRDIGLRHLLRRRLDERGLDPDSFTGAQLKKSVIDHGPLTHDSGVPIHNVVLLWSNSDPVKIERDTYGYSAGKHSKDTSLNALRLYDSQNNHHIEIRVARNKNGTESWSGSIVTAFKAAQQKIIRLREIKKLEKAYRHLRMRLTKSQKQGLSAAQIDELSKTRLREWKRAMRDLRPQRKAIIDAYPIVNRSNTNDGEFVMSLAEGEMLLMKHKHTNEVGYFVVAELIKNKRHIVLVPHWDARKATPRKDTEGNKVADSIRDEFVATPTDLKDLAPPGYSHAIKVRVTPLGEITHLSRD
jgi:CRISPR-associated endonuclease Csn1